MTDRLPAAFAIDHGTATTAAALIAHVDGGRIGDSVIDGDRDPPMRVRSEGERAVRQ